jgi:uncharacterized protein
MMDVAVYKSSRKRDTYLLVRVEDALTRVPAELFDLFGEATFSFQFVLDENRRMPRIDTADLRARLSEAGYWLQLPPAVEV